MINAYENNLNNQSLTVWPPKYCTNLIIKNNNIA